MERGCAAPRVIGKEKSPRGLRTEATVREERGQISGDVIVYEPFTLWGNVGGDVKVIERGKLYIRGAVYGDVVVEYGGRMHVFGRITGSLTVHRGAKVIHSGVLGGDLINLGGRVFIDHIAKIMGKVKTEKGETTVQQAPRVPK